MVLRSSVGTGVAVLAAGASGAVDSADRAACAVAVASCYHLHSSLGQVVAYSACTVVVAAVDQAAVETVDGAACSAVVAVVVAFAVVASLFDFGSFVDRWGHLEPVGCMAFFAAAVAVAYSLDFVERCKDLVDEYSWHQGWPIAAEAYSFRDFEKVADQAEAESFD